MYVHFKETVHVIVRQFPQSTSTDRRPADLLRHPNKNDLRVVLPRNGQNDGRDRSNSRQGGDFGPCGSFFGCIDRRHFYHQIRLLLFLQNSSSLTTFVSRRSRRRKKKTLKRWSAREKRARSKPSFFFFSSPFVLRLARVYKCRNNNNTFLHGVKKKKKKKKFLQKKKKKRHQMKKGTDTNERNRVNT